MERNHEESMDGFEDVTARLRSERPTLTAFELDRIKLDARTRANRAAQRSARKGSFMRSRLAITSLLVVGILMSGTGAALSISGASDSGSPADAQYPTQPTQTVNPTTETGSTPSTPTGTQPVSPLNDPVEAQEVRSADQVSTSDTLPFTGFAAIPVLIGGLVLLGAGLVLRRGSDRNKKDSA